MLDFLSLFSIDKALDILFTFTSAFFSYKTLLLCYFISTIGGITFLLDYTFIRAYNRFLNTLDRYILDMESNVEQSNFDVDYDTGMRHCKVESENVYPFVDEMSSLTKFIMYLQILITLPLSLIYAPLVILWSKKGYTDELIRSNYRNMVRTRKNRSIIISLIHSIWSFILVIITLCLLILLITASVLVFVPYFAG